MIAKKFRLHQKSDFDKLAKSSNKFYSNNFVLKLVKNDEDFNCFAVVVSKKISLKAVIRNKIRRRVYEIIRLNMDNFQKSFKIIIFVKKGVLEMEYSKLEKELLYLFEKARLR
jgi:ribonuclease P protein component